MDNFKYYRDNRNSSWKVRSSEYVNVLFFESKLLPLPLFRFLSDLVILIKFKPLLFKAKMILERAALITFHGLRQAFEISTCLEA